MLKLALNAAKSQNEFLSNLAEEVRMQEVKSLLYRLAKSELRAVEKIAHMMATGIVDELEELASESRDSIPDDKPIRRV